MTPFRSLCLVGAIVRSECGSITTRFGKWIVSLQPRRVQARKLFDEMPVRDLASWSAMIAVYVNNGCWGKGLTLFQKIMVMALG